MAYHNESKSELQRIRRDWKLQQQRMEAHRRRKEIMIKEYEIQQKRRLKRLTGGMSLYKGPKGTQINSTELRKIKVDIYRNIPGQSAANDLQRDIVNPEDVVVKRRAGEGSKPIFEREELIKAVSNAEEVEERRTVATVGNANLENKLQTPRRRSASLSLTRNRSYSHRRTSFRRSRYEDYKHNDRETRRSKGDRSRSRERKKDRQRTQSCHVRSEKRLDERRSGRDSSRSRERNKIQLDRNSRHSKSFRGRSGVPVTEQIPIPIYYGNFPPRPIMVGTPVPIRGHVTFGDSRYPMWPMTPFGPRFSPRIDIFRFHPPGNPRGFKPQY